MFAVRDELRFEFGFRQVQFTTNNVCSVTQTFESPGGIPIEKAGPAVDQVFERADHFVSTHVLYLRANRFSRRIRALVNSHHLGADFIRVESITSIENSEIRSQFWATSNPVGKALGDCFIRAADSNLIGLTFRPRRVAANEFDDAVEHTRRGNSRGGEFASDHAH